MKRMPAVLLDTCIWIDNYDSSRSHARVSQKLISYCLDNDIPLLYAATSIKDVAYNIAVNLKRQKRAAGETLDDSAIEAINEVSMACVANMLEIATAVAIDQSDIGFSIKLKSLHRDFEDNLVLAAMERSGASYLVTLDEKLIVHSPYATMNPEDMLRQFEVLMGDLG